LISALWTAASPRLLFSIVLNTAAQHCVHYIRSASTATLHSFAHHSELQSCCQPANTFLAPLHQQQLVSAQTYNVA
jgi:hypothetical protein